MQTRLDRDPKMKKSNQRSRKRPATLSYGRLEPRQLLATTGIPQFDGDTQLDAFIVQNGAFEANNLPAGDHLLDADSVSGWDVADPGAQINLIQMFDSPRGAVLQLNASEGQQDRIVQNIPTEQGVEYTLAFDIRRGNVAADADSTANSVQVLWNGENLGTFRGIKFWQTIVVHVSGNAGNRSTLEFREIAGEGNDGSGPLIDNVRLVKSSSVVLGNGGFETSDGSGVVDAADVTSWNSYGEIGSQKIDLRSDGASQGVQYVNLDSSDTHVDRLYRYIPTEAGATYVLSFDLKSSDGINDQSQEIRVRWNDAWAGTFRGDKDWQSFGITLRANSDLTRLVLREPPIGDFNAGDGSGPMLDNVRLVKVDTTFAVDFGSATDFTFDEGDPAQPIASGLQIQAPAMIQGAQVVLSESDDREFESLAVNVLSTSITQNFDRANGILQLTGEGSVEDYQNVLRTLTYSNTSQTPSSSNRSVSVSVSTSTGTSPHDSIQISMTPINNRPFAGFIENQNADVAKELVIAMNATDVDGDGLSYSLRYDANLIQSDDNHPTINDQGVIRWMPSRPVSIHLTAEVTDGELSYERSFLVTVAEPIETGTVNVIGNALPPFVSQPDPAIGMTAPTFDAQSFDGSSVSIRADGTARLYTFMAHW